MQIVYYYIEELNDIKQQNINFGDKYIFNYDPITKELTAEENELYIENFYGDNINITAIIGENGTGKTSLINNLIELNDLFFNSNKFIVITKTNNQYKISYQGLEVINSNAFPFKKINYIKKNLSSNLNSGLKNISFQYSEIFENTDIIFYSNILNFNTNTINNYIKNISTQHLLYNLNEIKSSDFEYNLAYNYSVKENLKIIDFISSSNIVKSLIKYPEEVFLFFDIEKFYYFRTGYNENTRYYLENLKTTKYAINSRLKINVIVYILFYYVDDNIDNRNKAAGDVKNHKQKYIERQIKLRNDFLVEINKIIENDENISISKAENLLFSKLNDILQFGSINREYIESIRSFINETFKIIDSTIQNNPDFLKFEINDDKIKNLLNSSKDLTRNRPFFNIEFRDISSGEESLLTLFARLYAVINSPNIENDNIIIFIDEIDLYFHPDWQKKLISKLLEFFKSQFEDKKIHLIFTANNPLMISDMLSYNTIFLQKVDNNTTIINNSLTDHKNTFAANIHTLLSDSFFMKNGTMGDFAKNKLNDIIDQLNHKKVTISETERENIKKTIKLIGEPIIRKKLMSMYNECFYDDVISRIDRLEELMKKLGDDKS
ncbi:ATP-binding protein [Empedobacter falsenii]